MATLIRTSERTNFARCRQQWWWYYVENLRPKTTAPAFRFGSLVHKALELRYPPGVKRGPHPAKTFLRLYEDELREQEAIGFRDEDGKWMKAGELGVAMMEAFVEKYGKDEDWEVLSSEQTFRVKISKDLTYVGTFDGVWRRRSNGELFLKEWKTAAQIWTEHLGLDEQAGSYWAFAPAFLRKRGILAPEEEMKGILYTFLRKQMPDKRPENDLGQKLNQDGSVSKKQPSPLFERKVVYRSKFDRQMIRQRTFQQAEEMRMIRSGQLGLWKTTSNQHCGFCPFRDPCELHEGGHDYRPLLRAAFEQYDPYDAHHIKEEGK